MPTPRKYNSPAEQRAANNAARVIADLPRKLAVVRRRHHDIVKEIKRANLGHLLEAEEKDW